MNVRVELDFMFTLVCLNISLIIYWERSVATLMVVSSFMLKVCETQNQQKDSKMAWWFLQLLTFTTMFKSCPVESLLVEKVTRTVTVMCDVLQFGGYTVVCVLWPVPLVVDPLSVSQSVSFVLLLSDWVVTSGRLLFTNRNFPFIRSTFMVVWLHNLP